MTGYQADCTAKIAQTPSEEAVRAAVVELVRVTGLTPIAGLAAQVAAEEGGVYALQVVAESHVAIHARDGGVIATVFSCRPFDVFGAIEVLRTLFGGSWLASAIIRRMPDAH